MSEKKWIQVGRVRDAHGIKGEIFLALRAGSADWLSQFEELAISRDSDQTRTVYEVLNFREHKDGLILTLKGVHDRNEAERLRGSFGSIPESYLVTNPDEAPFLISFLGVKVVDKKLGDVGVVVGFSSNGAQDLLKIEGERFKFEMPLVDAFIIRQDLPGKLLEVDLPEGLTESQT